VSVVLNRPESATVIAGLQLLAGDGVRVPNYPCVLVPGLCDETDPEYEFSLRIIRRLSHLTDVRRYFTPALALWLAAAAAVQAADDISGLNIRIVDGEGQKYALGSRATRGMTVELQTTLASR
jgi:hypothetical protein